MFTCTAYGIPKPIVAWFQSDVKLMNNTVFEITSSCINATIVTSYLTITDIDLGYGGAVFTCFAENSVGNVSSSAILEVLCKCVVYRTCQYYQSSCVNTMLFY